ncbi:hypothetical protein CSKR_112402 [Clonorchis sinensis]|uniref:Uncharacterized protein n=1 Tax=Clonorchis sinensis TaxID=79923 RepID=A0A419PHR7_CLOSI|nr:hypothetical protein CSKR_112402 [Clonorchis sinensis]
MVMWESTKYPVYDILQLNLLQHGLHMLQYTHLHINLVFTEDSTESLVCETPQMNALHQGRLMFRLVRYSKYRSIFSYRKLPTRLLKTLRLRTTDFVLLGAHQIGAVPEFPST